MFLEGATFCVSPLLIFLILFVLSRILVLYNSRTKSLSFRKFASLTNFEYLFYSSLFSKGFFLCHFLLSFLFIVFASCFLMLKPKSHLLLELGGNIPALNPMVWLCTRRTWPIFQGILEDPPPFVASSIEQISSLVPYFPLTKSHVIGISPSFGSSSIGFHYHSQCLVPHLLQIQYLGYPFCHYLKPHLFFGPSMVLFFFPRGIKIFSFFGFGHFFVKMFKLNSGFSFPLFLP